MMPLYLAEVSKPQIVRKVNGIPETKKHLEDLGFTPGSTVTVLNTIAGNLIVRVKESRVAVSREMACKIMI